MKTGLMKMLPLLLLIPGLLLACDGGDDDDTGSGPGQAQDDDNDNAADDDDDNDDDDDDATADCNAYSDSLPDPEGVCPGNPDSIFPAPTGPYCVGTTAPIHLVDPSRAEPFTPGNPNDSRELMIQLWYPVAADAAGDYAPYMDAATAAYEAGIPPATWVSMPAAAFEQERSHALLEAPIVASLKKFPVLLFSPGLKREYQLYTSVIEDLVSHGCIVAAINHPYVSGLTVFPDDRTVEVVLPADEAGTLDLVVGDALFVLDTLTQWNADFENDLTFACRFDLDKAAMFGHSYGGATAVGAAVADDRLRAALNIDGPTFGPAIVEGTATPLFYLLSEDHEAAENFDALWDLLTGPGFQAILAGTEHMTYSDYPLLLHDFAPTRPLWTLEMGTIEPTLALEIANRYLGAFFDVYLRGAPPDDLLALGDDYPEVTFQTKNVGR